MAEEQEAVMRLNQTRLERQRMEARAQKAERALRELRRQPTCQTGSATNGDHLEQVRRLPPEMQERIAANKAAALARKRQRETESKQRQAALRDECGILTSVQEERTIV